MVWWNDLTYNIILSIRPSMAYEIQAWLVVFSNRMRHEQDPEQTKGSIYIYVCVRRRSYTRRVLTLSHSLPFGCTLFWPPIMSWLLVHMSANERPWHCPLIFITRSETFAVLVPATFRRPSVPAFQRFSVSALLLLLQTHSYTHPSTYTPINLRTFYFSLLRRHYTGDWLKRLFLSPHFAWRISQDGKLNTMLTSSV